MDPETTCINAECRHELKYHAPCSLCGCPQFVEPAAEAPADELPAEEATA